LPRPSSTSTACKSIGSSQRIGRCLLLALMHATRPLSRGNPYIESTCPRAEFDRQGTLATRNHAAQQRVLSVRPEARRHATHMSTLTTAFRGNSRPDMPVEFYASDPSDLSLPQIWISRPIPRARGTRSRIRSDGGTTHPLRKPRAAGRIGCAGTPLAQRTHDRSPVQYRNHRRPRGLQRPHDQQDNLACLPRPRSR
jgi:hypothetical protein